MRAPVSERGALAFPDRIRAASKYVPEWLDIDRAEYLCLDRNENPHPVPGPVAAALAAWIAERGVQSYPQSDRLRPALASYCGEGVAADWVLPTNGSDQAIDLTLRCFLAQGSRMLVARPEFPIFGHVATTLGVEVTGVPFLAPGMDFPYDAFRGALRSVDPHLVVLINPNNPTGTAIDLDFIDEVVASVPGTPVVVDEAYFEFTGATVVPLVHRYGNLIVLRTFSKAFAMAGLRLGYVVAQPDVIAQVAKVRNPFDVNELAVVAALAQLADPAPMRAHVEEIVGRSRPWLVARLTAAGVPVINGAGNFVLVGPPEGLRDAVVDYLFRQHILVRPMHAPALAGMFRLTLGTPAGMERFVDVYLDFLREKGCA